MFKKTLYFSYSLFLIFFSFFGQISYASQTTAQRAVQTNQIATELGIKQDAWFSTSEKTISTIGNGLLAIDNLNTSLKAKGVSAAEIVKMNDVQITALKVYAAAMHKQENIGYLTSDAESQVRNGNMLAAQSAFNKTLANVSDAYGLDKEASIYNEGAVELQKLANEAYIKDQNNRVVALVNQVDKAMEPTAGSGGSYTFLAPLPFFGGPSINIAEGGLAGYLDGLYKAGVAVATGLALIMIVAGGLEYASAGSVGGKEGGKGKIKNALMGLLLALTSFIILQQINPGLVRNDLAVDATKAVGGITGQTVDLVAGGGTINQTIPPGQPGSYVLANNENPPDGTVFSNYSSLRQLLNSLPGGPRSTDGSLIFTNYWNGDDNTNQQRGNNCNLLVSGSVALSPDLISTYSPRKGAAVYVNGLLVGYFDDTTGVTTLGSIGGTLIKNTIDIYDPHKTLGMVLKKMPPGSWYLVFGTQRAQTPNPCPPRS